MDGEVREWLKKHNIMRRQRTLPNPIVVTETMYRKLEAYIEEGHLGADVMPVDGVMKFIGVPILKPEEKPEEKKIKFREFL